MANTRELRRRIKSVKNTSQITRAMEMVAATKMKRAQNQALSGRTYSENLYASLALLLPRINPEDHPLLSGNSSQKVGIVLLSTDKGLVGSLNTNLVRILVAGQGDVFYTIGKKGRNFAVKSGKNLAGDFESADTVTFRQSVQLTKMILEAFKSGEIGQVFLIYPQFISTLKQEPKKVKLLPVEPVILNPAKPDEGSQDLKSRDSSQARNDNKEFLFEPDVDSLLDFILIHHLEEQIYQALLETKASEHSSRMVAMKNATDNAKDLVEDLQLNYNQIRQDAITREILEIASASAAME